MGFIWGSFRVICGRVGVTGESPGGSPMIYGVSGVVRGCSQFISGCSWLFAVVRGCLRLFAVVRGF